MLGRIFLVLWFLLSIFGLVMFIAGGFAALSNMLGPICVSLMWNGAAICGLNIVCSAGFHGVFEWMDGRE